MSTRWKHWVFWAGISIAGAAATQLLGTVRFFELLNLKALDAHFIVRGKVPTSDIMLVVADQKTLNTFPELQVFWHPYYAEAIRGAGKGGARVVGLDVAFGVPVTQWAPDNDRLLAEAVATSEIPVVCGYVPSLAEKQEEWPIPVNIISSSLGLSAFANLTVDVDDFVRNQELIEAPPASAASEGTPLARCFGLRLAEKYLGTDAQFRNGKLVLQGHVIPISRQRTIAINYAGPPETFPRVSLADFVAASRAGRIDQLQDWVRGKAVLIGPDNIEDRHATPFYTMLSGPRWTTAGVEIHANTLETLLKRNYLLPVPPWARAAALIAVGGVTAVIGTSLALTPAAAWLALTVLATMLVTHLLFRAGFVLSTFELLLTWLICLMVSVVYRFATAEKRRDLFRNAVALFVGKKLATTLDESAKISLSGTRQIVTILFTDIRGFTAFCEEKDPSLVVGLLNEYMRTMVSIIVRHHGQVNKFIGDGILAIFSDEDGCIPGDHPVRAVQCATEMVTAPGLFKTGAGLHTGPAVVGNVGSEDKMEYTVLGDTVNLASRLESLNKEHKTRLLMSGATHELLGDQVNTVHLGAVPVRGKAAPVELYTVASLVATPAAVSST